VVGRISKEVLMTCFKVLYRYSPGWTEDVRKVP
jgi:hypothetical protein